MAEKEPVKLENEAEPQRKKFKNTYDVQRFKLEKLMKNPEKPVIIPDRQKEKKAIHVPDFVRNVMGSSAGAGSGEFHVYRHLRRKEYARQKQIQELNNKEKRNEEYNQKLEQYRKEQEEKTAKRRAKRLKKKAKIKEKLKSKKLSGKDQNKKENKKSEESNDDTDEDVHTTEENESNEPTTEREEEGEKISSVLNSKSDIMKKKEIESNNEHCSTKKDDHEESKNESDE